MAQFFTDFSEYTADAQPSDWTERWNTGDGAANVRNSGIPGTPSTGGSHALEITKTALSYYVLSWDDVGTPSGDVQILTLCYFEHTSDVNNVIQSFLHGSGAASSENAYAGSFAFTNTNETQLIKLDNGSATQLASSDEGNTRNQWLWVRLDRSGTTIRARVWADGTSEPETWTVSITDSAHSSGWVGLGAFGDSGSSWFAQIGVGTGGDTAPSEAPLITASGTAAIAVIADPSAIGTKQASGSAALAIVAATNATGSKQGDGAASLAVIAATAATGSRQTSGAAQLAVIAATSGAGGKQVSGAAALAVIAATAASGSGSEAVIGTAAITVIAALAASGAKHETGAAAIVVTVSLSALGSSPGEALLYRGQQGRGLPTGKATI